MQVSVVSVTKRCAYCNEPLHITEQGIEAHPAGAQLACSEFCAEAIREEANQLPRAP